MAKRDQQNNLGSTRTEGQRGLHLREVTDDSKNDSGYDGVGRDLRSARLELNKERREAATDLHIRRSYIKAIEEGRFGELPASVYAYGFVRSYAEYLGLDEESVVRRFKNEWEGLGTSTRLAFPEPPEEIRLPRGPLIAFSLLLAVAVYGGWYYMSNRDRVELELIPDVPERLAGLVDQGAAKPIKAETEKPVAPVEPVASAEPAQPAPEKLAPTPAVVAEKKKPAVTVAKPKAEKVVASPGAPANNAGNVYGNTNIGRVSVRATADAWIQVQADRQGEVFITRILHAGDVYRAPARNDLILMTGNAGGLEILVDNNKVAAIGEIGTVRRRVLLDPDRLISGTAVDEN